MPRTTLALILAAACSVAFSAAFSARALADKQVTADEAEKIQAALKPWGCAGGKMEQETEATGVYEVDDAKCHDGQFDIKLDRDFKVIVITRD